ncbi:MAG TPA: NAD-dependent epimerase/dehydratase family protein [bacterium]|nr:NAD-dependent epimerase/dehydratase family protein [bacterium]
MQLEGRRILLTGGAGFIGTQLVRKLAPANRVVIYDNLHRNALRYVDLASYPNVEVVKGDVLDRDAVIAAAASCDVVIHLAAIAGVDTVMEMPTLTMKVNLLGTLNVLDAAVSARVQRFVDFSTSEVFGSHVYMAEEHSATALGVVGESRWTYAVSKLAAEHLVSSYHKEHGLPAVTIRPFNVYGPQQVGVGAIHTFVVDAIKGNDLVIHGDGNQIRSWCYIDDMVDGALLCLENDSAIGHVFNIGNPRATVTVANLALLVRRLCSSASKIVYGCKDHVDVELRIPSIKKAQNLLGFWPKVDLEEGLARTIAWYRDEIHDQTDQA